MHSETSPSAASPDRRYIPGAHFSTAFLELLQAPPYTVKLAFSCEAGGLLKCKATYWTGIADEQDEKEWEVSLPKDSTLYKIITGEN